MSNHRYRQFNITIEMDSQFEDPKEFLTRLNTAVAEGDESVEIKVAGEEFFVEILAVGP